MKQTIMVWECPECDKVIKSIYPSQLESNKNYHIGKHRKKEREKNEKKGQGKVIGR